MIQIQAGVVLEPLKALGSSGHEGSLRESVLMMERKRLSCAFVPSGA